MPELSDAAREAFRDLKAETVNAMNKIYDQRAAVLATPGQAGAQQLATARRNLSARLEKIAAAERAFLLSDVAINELVGRLGSVTSDVRTALSRMDSVQATLDQATRIVKLLHGLVRLMA